MGEAERAERGGGQRSEEADACSKDGAGRVGDDAIARFCADADYDLRAPGMGQIVERLKNLAVGTLIKLNASGQLMIKAAGVLKIPKGKIPLLPPDWPHCADDMFEDVADFAATTFITDQLPKWDPSGRASLNTWFINYCLIVFWDAIKKMRLERQDLEYDLDAVAKREDCRPSPEERAIRQDAFRFALDTTTAEEGIDMRLVIKRIVEGVGRPEIARELGVSVSGLFRARQRFAAILNENGFSIRTGGQ